MSGVSDVFEAAGLNRHPRIVDMKESMRDATGPLPYRVRPIALDGTLTLLAGRRGESKTWLGMVACAAVQSGFDAGPLSAMTGPALYVDAENGHRMMGRRFISMGLDPDCFTVADGMGLHLPRDIGEIYDLVEEVGAKLVVLDSLRRLTPNLDENSSNDMAPAMAALSKLTRDAGCAVVLIHHRSAAKFAKDSRGSSAIEDQVDAVFVLEKVQGDPEFRNRRRLRCVKMRMDVEPSSIWLEFKTKAGFMTIAEAEPFNSGDGDAHVPMREAIAEEIRGLADRVTADGGWRPEQVAEAVSRRRDNQSFKAALKLLTDAGEWESFGSTRDRKIRPRAIWGDRGAPLGDTTTTPNQIPMLEESESPVNTGDSGSGDSDAIWGGRNGHHPKCCCTSPAPPDGSRCSRCYGELGVER